MDPFTEKLLERTRARRENLQKKMSERPNAANRQMAKRTREPLAEANSVLSEPILDIAPHPASKPSPSKRRCSEENAPPPAAGEENRGATTPKRSDPQTNMKPPMGPATVRSASSLEKSATRPPVAVQSHPEQVNAVQPHLEQARAVQPHLEQARAVQPEPERSAAPEQKMLSRDVEMIPSSPAPQRNRDPIREEEPKETPATSGMRSRLQRLAQQRNHWDGEEPSDDVPSPLRRVDVAPVAAPAASSGPPLGRKGRLANLAATICSWEDDLSHATIPTAKEQPAPARGAPSSANRSAASGPSSSANRSAASGPSSSANRSAACGPSSSANRSTTCGPSPGYKSTAYGPSSGYRGIGGGAVAPAAAATGPKLPAADIKPTTVSNEAVGSPVKSTRVVPSSPQKANVPEVRSAVQAGRGGALSSPAASPQKSSIQGRAFPSGPSAAASGPQSPLKSQALSSRGLDVSASPKKPELHAKPAATPGRSVLQSREMFVAKDTTTTPLQQRGTTGTPVVKSFMDRFGERCQERSNQSSPASAQAKTPTAVTPSTRLAQDRLRAAQAASTTTTATADLTQRQKLERESELAQIRNRFQKGTNMWKNMSEATDAKEAPQTKVEPTAELEVVQSQSNEEPTAPSAGGIRATTISTPTGIVSGLDPVSTSSPLRRVDLDLTVEKPSEEESPEGETSEETTPEETTPEEEEEVREVEMNVDQSINSAVINELFDGVLDQSDEEEEEDDEEDALNISSMSLLVPLAETVASVIKSPERRMMTSTPACSFLEKTKSPDAGPSPRRSKFQRARTSQAGVIDALDDDHKLLYSIDAYRSTRVKEMERPSVKQAMVRNEDVSGRLEEAARGHSHASIKQKMKIMTNDMNLQQTIIHQASQALNCCTDQEHGKGSQVEAEAERLLLIATEKRLALKAELERLKGEGPQRTPRAQDDMGVSASKGSLSLLELRLPLKADFVCATANRPESSNHYFFLMIRAGAENTVATPLCSTRGLTGDALTFSTKFTMSDVSNDFEVAIEVYCLVQKRELPNEKKKKPSKSKAITPKRFLAITKSSQTPVVASPGGPNAIRTSNFALVGSHRLTLASIGKNKFVLEKIRCEGIERELLSDMFQKKVPFLCPLEGHIHLKMQCEVGSNVEERGFLTMFEDVSGFGAWHRRWCVLSGYCISYWTYPDDEKRKNPIGRINLANCTSRKVEPAKREFCARPNTFELITVRPQRPEDRETLVSQCNNTMCVTKNWLGADTKDERNLWMQKLNQLLVDLRMWQPDSCYGPL